MEVIKLNLIPTGALPVVHASQYDEGRTFRAELFEGSAVYTLDGTEVLECDVKKPDGNVVTVAVVNTSASYVDIDTTLQMCACSGESLAELNIKKGGDSIGTLNFILAVERSPLENGITSDSGIHNLQTQIGDAVADQYDAANVVFDAAPTAGHGVGFAVTSEGVKTAVDNVAATIPEELDDLQDVTTSAPTSGEALVWDGSKWTNGTPDENLDDLGDVAITTPTAGEILEYDGAEWVNVANPASTDNFGAPYDENTTYNVPSIVIYNNLLYKLNDGEDGTTGPWDPTKWTQTSLAELSGADIPIGTSSDPSTIAGAVGAKQDALTVSDNNLSVATYGGTIYYRKYGNIVEVTATGIGSTTSIAQGNEPTLATLPSGYRPKRELNPIGYSRNSFSNSRMLGYTIGTNGNIKVYAYEEITSGRFTCSYIVD